MESLGNSSVEYITILHSCSFISALLNILAIYCILFESTQYMKRYKWYLLNVQIWVFSTDLILFVLIAPRFYFPLIAGTMNGIFFHIGMPYGVQTIIGFGTGVGMIAASTHAIQYRHTQILPADSILIRYPSIGIFMNSVRYFILCGVAIPAVLNEPKNQIEAKFRIEKKYPQFIPPAFFENHVYLLQESPVLVAIPGLFVICYIAFELFYYISHSIMRLNNRISHMADRTKQMQKKYFLCICIQVFVPAVFCLTPIAFLCFAIVFDIQAQLWNDIAVIAFGLHGTIATSFMLILYKPYRNYFLLLISCQSRKVSDSNSVLMITYSRKLNMNV